MSNPTHEIEPLIRIEEVALRLGMKRRGIEKMFRRRAIPVIRISRSCIRFRWSDVRAALDGMTVRELR